MLKDRVTEVLAEASREGGPDRGVVDRLVPLVYEELRRMARAQLARESDRLTLDTTGLVHEAWLKLVDGDWLPLKGRAYFFGAAVRAMRQVLVEAARRRNRVKRGGGERPVTIDLETNDIGIDVVAEELVAVDEALSRLGASYPRPARALECRYFGGLTVEETAEALEVSARTVDRDLAFAHAWMRRELDAG